MLKFLLQLTDQSFSVALVLCESHIDLTEVILEVVVGGFKVHDEVLLLVDVELNVFNLFPIIFHHFLKIVECVFGEECEFLNLRKVGMVLLIQVLFLFERQCDLIYLPLHVPAHHLRSEISKSPLVVRCS